jgi:predicted CxxxxCH...CXXCH cytochrome family protein
MNRSILRTLASSVAAAALVLIGCSELKDDVQGPTSSGSQIHPPEWIQPSSSGFHGSVLKANSWDDTGCKPCHGGDYTGGTAEVSCFTCHVPYPHSAQFPGGRHTAYLRGALFPLEECQACHGADYDGGPVVDISCLSSGCHVDASGTPKPPEACNTCHGQFRSPAGELLSWAPPKSVAGDTSTTVVGVGAHQAHLQYGNAGVSVKCQECHTVPAAWNAPGHIAGMPAEVVFNDTLANLPTGDGLFVPTNLAYVQSSMTCQNTYCHGNWEARRASSPNQFGYADSIMVGNNASPVWIGGSAEAFCGSCHGLPPTGHIAATLNSCVNCHPGVVNGQGAITDETKHINGKINVFAQERPF